MSIWFHEPTLDEIRQLCQNTMVSHLDIEFTEIGDDHLTARMPVNANVHQPDGVLHGGASAVLAETLGSVAANLCVDRSRYICVGLEINANHLRPVRDGMVEGNTKPVHRGKSTHIWAIEIFDEKKRLVCVSRLTMAVINKSGS